MSFPMFRPTELLSFTVWVFSLLFVWELPVDLDSSQ